MSAGEETLLIVNPQSRSGRTGTRLGELSALARTHLRVTPTVTEGPGHATELARAATARGVRRIVVAGGDGTVNEVLNGVLERAPEERPELGFVPMGTGRDFARLLGLGGEPGEALARIATGGRRRGDAGRVTYRDAGGQERSRYFLNIASFGLTGEAALWLEERAKQGKRGKLSYVASGLVGLARYRAPAVTLRVDGEPLYEGRLSLTAVANGQYFAGGMRVAPGARVDDGLFDVVAVPKLPMGRSLAEFPRLVRGAHVESRDVKVGRGRQVEAQSDGTVWIEADGEPIGTLPARFDLLEGAVSLCGLVG